MQTPKIIHLIEKTHPELASKIRQQVFFLRDNDIVELSMIKDYRLILVLVRCGGGRFLTPMQDAKKFINIIVKEGSDYIRDVSLPCDNWNSTQ